MSEGRLLENNRSRPPMKLTGALRKSELDAWEIIDGDFACGRRHRFVAHLAGTSISYFNQRERRSGTPKRIVVDSLIVEAHGPFSAPEEVALEQQGCVAATQKELHVDVCETFVMPTTTVGNPSSF